MFPRRILIVVLVLMGLMALVASLAPRPATQPDSAAPGSSAATVQAGDGLSTTEDADVTATLSAAPGAKARTVKAELGDQVELTVEADAIDSVALGDLDTKPVEPSLPATFELFADTPGRYPLVTVSDERRIGTLVIR